MFKRLDLAIINRSFWPVYPVIGEALMRFAEQQSREQAVAVILQDHADIKTHLKRDNRGQGVQFFPCHALSVSGSSILRRAFDAVFFMLWVFSILLLKRPKKVYVSTDPPVLVPFVVMILARLDKACHEFQHEKIRDILLSTPTGFNPTDGICDLVWLQNRADASVFIL